MAEMEIRQYLIDYESTILEAMNLIESNKKGFVTYNKKLQLIFGTLADGDISSAIINGSNLQQSIKKIVNTSLKDYTQSDSFHTIINKFKHEKIEFLPILNDHNEIMNVLTKEQLHEILLQSRTLDLSQDFTAFDGSTVTHEIYNRPWGFYKTVFLSEFAQAKIIHVG